MHKGQVPRGKKCVKKQAENWLIPINGHLIDSNELLDENLLVYEPQSRSKVCASIYFFVIFYFIILKLSFKENFKIICDCWTLENDNIIIAMLQDLDTYQENELRIFYSFAMSLIFRLKPSAFPTRISEKLMAPAIMKVAYYLQRGRWDGFLAKGTHTRTFQFSAARISYASVRFCQHSSAPTRFSCILNFHVLKKNWIIFGNVHHLKVFDGKIASKIYEYKQTNHNKKSWKYYKKYAEVWSQIAFPKKFHTHAHYKHFCNSLTQFLYTFQVFSSLHCKDWTMFHLGPDGLLHYIHDFITKGRSILFNHFIDMRTTVNLSISCRKKRFCVGNFH